MSRDDEEPGELRRELHEESRAEIAEQWFARRLAEHEAKIKALGVPELRIYVAQALSRFAGSEDFMFNVAVGTRRRYYERQLGLTYPDAVAKAIAMTHLLTGRGRVQ